MSSGFSSTYSPATDMMVMPSSGTVRQTVLQGAVDSNGQAAILQIGTGLAVDLLAATVPVVFSFAAGFDDCGPVDKIARVDGTQVGAWSGLPANSTAYLYAHRDPGTGQLTYGYSTVAPVYSAVDPSNTVLVPVMTSNTNGTVTVSASSETQPAWNAFARVVGGVGGASGAGTFWQSSTPACWLKVDHGTGNRKVVLKYGIQGYQAARGYDPKTWTLEGSNDGTTWTVLDTQTNITFPDINKKYFTLAAIPAAYQMHRINITANNGNSTTVIDEFELDGVAENQHWFDLNQFVMKFWVGTAWTAYQRVFVGEAVTGASSVTSVTSYALRGRYDSDWFTVNASTSNLKNHNLGVSFPVVQYHLTRRTDGTGNVVMNDSIYSGAYYGGLIRGLDSRNTVDVFAGNPAWWDAPSGASATAQYRIALSRGW